MDKFIEIQKKIDEMLQSDEETAIMAAYLLNSINPSSQNLEAFFNRLDSDYPPNFMAYIKKVIYKDKA